MLPQSRIIAAGLALALLHACSASTYFCDDFAEGVCRDRQPENRTYTFKAPAEKLSSWRSLADYMYFHSRETPGLRHEFAQPLSARETARLRSELSCDYTLKSGLGSTKGELEGRRVDEEGRGLWCFDYLGAMLKKHLGHFGRLEDPPNPGFFPIELELRADLGGLAGAALIRRTAQVRVNWQAQ